MKTLRFLLTATLLAASAPVSAELNLARAEVSHLPDGLTVIMLEDHSFPVVSVQMLYKSGSAAEVTGKTGLAHFLEHLAFRGSENFPQARATELIYDAGGEWHGYTAMDQTTYFSTMPKDQLDLLLRIEADRMARVIIDPASIAAEKGAVITELHSYENDPASVLQEAVTRTAIQAHPYGSPMAGYVSDVAQLTADDARAYYSSHYAPGNAVLAIVGDFVPAEAKALVARDFADVPARAVAKLNLTPEPVQRGERRTVLHGAVDRRYFQVTYPAPAASSPDFPAFMVLQEILCGGSGLNLHQTDWAPTTPSVSGSLLFGATNDIATWLPPTRDPFLFMIGGSIGAKATGIALERDIERRIGSLRDWPISDARLATARRTVLRAIAEDVQTTEDAAHQLAFFEGVGGLDQLLNLPSRVTAVTPADIQRVVRTYLAPDRRTIGWMLPGEARGAPAASGNPTAAADRPGAPAPAESAGPPQLRRLPAGLPAMVQPSPLSDSITVELLLSAPVMGGTWPEDLPGLDAIVRTGPPHDLEKLVSQIVAAAAQPATAEAPSNDPATRLQQLIARQTGPHPIDAARPLAVIVSGNLDPADAFKVLERRLGALKPGKLSTPTAPEKTEPKSVSERIGQPLAQGGIGYVVEGPAPGSREAFAWRMLLYVLTHDYSGRLGNSAIRDQGLVYYIGSAVRTDGRRTWAVLSSGVDPDKADAVEAELRSQIARLAADPPTAAETEAARNHLLGRDLTAAQSNEELAAKLARQYVETGGLRSHRQLRAILETITPADLAAIAPSFAKGTIVRVDVAVPDRAGRLRHPPS
jgi:predicted Zn-dependent peptidase